MRPDENRTSAPESSPNTVTVDQKPIEPLIVNSPAPIPHNKSHKKIIIISVLILLLVGGSVFALYGYNHQSKPVSRQTNNTSVSTKTSQSTTKTGGAVITKYVNLLPATSNNFPTATDPKTAHGNYIIELDNQGGVVSGPPVNQELIYDGKTLYRGTNLSSDVVVSWAISESGLRYAYVLSKGGSDDLYIDGKFVTTISPSDVYQGDLTVSNNGQDYAYVVSVGSNLKNSEVIKDGSVLYYSGNVIDDVDFSSDLSKYIIAVQTFASAAYTYDKVIYDGKIIAMNLGTGSPGSMAISENGKHTFYTNFTNKTYVDGNLVGNSQYIPFIDGGVVTDNGDYGLVDFASHYIDINGKITSISPTLDFACDPSCGVFAMNETATHYIVGNVNNSWYLDGAKINLTGNIEGVELDNNTLYVYVFPN
ncbi:hypothetical protein M1512_04015 [Patescibacteria group bacterium]|nr:hypothetical protein [Patescibacteria group bacterium]